jgi:hypothetical protein
VLTREPASAPFSQRWIGIDGVVKEHTGIVVQRQGPQPEWAETRREAGLGRAGLFRPAR